MKVLSTEAELNPASKQIGVQIVDGWVDVTATEVTPGHRVSGLSGKNLGVRLHEKVGSVSGNRRGFAIALRIETPDSPERQACQFTLSNWDTSAPVLVIKHQKFSSNFASHLAELPLDSP